MNYGFWLLMGQSAQTGVMSAQLRQMGHIASELELQRLTQAQQAALTQILFETENVVQRLQGLAAHDRFAGAIFAAVRLHGLTEIRPEFFHQYEAKRAWSTAIGALNGLWNAVDADPSLSARARAVLAAADELAQWRAFLGTDPEARAREYDAQTARAKQNVKRAKWICFGSFALVPLSIVGVVTVGVIAGATNAAKGATAVLATLLALMMIGGVLGGILAGIVFLSSRSSIKDADKKASEFRGQLARFDAFQNRHDGGQLLEAVAHHHPALSAGAAVGANS